MTDQGTKRVLSPLSPPPSAYTESATLIDAGGKVELKCIYEREGRLWAGGFVFTRVRAYRFLDEGHSTSWHVADAYDTLVEIEDSAWVADVRATEATPVPWGARHYLIYVDGAGAYEFLAASYEQMPELPATGGISL
jgi:hypothetical protein